VYRTLALNSLYEEARRCTSQNCFTAAVLLCRKMLMNIADKPLNLELPCRTGIGGKVLRWRGRSQIAEFLGGDP